jgi:hypothetical protein
MPHSALVLSTTRAQPSDAPPLPPTLLTLTVQIGKKMEFGTGVSWNAILEASAAAGKHPQAGPGSAGAGGTKPHGGAPAAAAAHALFVPDVSEHEGVNFFRPSASAGASHGSYLAVPLLGSRSEVLGLLGVDTVAAAGAAAVAAASGGASTAAGGPGAGAPGRALRLWKQPLGPTVAYLLAGRQPASHGVEGGI